jgi:hypothetical protein
MAHQVDDRAQQGLYEYDAVSRLRDSQLGDERVHDVANYIKRGKLWQAFDRRRKTVLLIDEIDKADIEFPNDLLQELDRMEFFVYETGETVRRAPAAHRDHHLQQRKGTARRLPAPLFLPLHPFPGHGDDEGDRRGASPRHQATLLTTALTQFYEIRDQQGLKKKPSTSEVLDWPKLLLADDLSSRGPAPRRAERAAEAARRAAEERAGRAPVRAAGVSWRGFLLLWGVASLFGKDVPWPPCVLAVLLTAGAALYANHQGPLFWVRVIAVSGFASVVYLMCCLLVWRARSTGSIWCWLRCS